ncbi:MAG: hypothetical protein KKA81_16005 [Bacteroidetes bacterium]|nr:hypothetical protein [Bacteroidota bacterium]
MNGRNLTVFIVFGLALSLGIAQLQLFSLVTVNVGKEYVEGLWITDSTKQPQLFRTLTAATIDIKPGGLFVGDVYFVYPQDMSIIGDDVFNAVVVAPKEIQETLEIHWVDVGKHPPTSPEDGFALMHLYRSKMNLLGSSVSSGSRVSKVFVGGDGVEYNEWTIRLSGFAFIPEGPRLLILVREIETVFQTLGFIRIRVDHAYVSTQPSQPSQPDLLSSWFKVPNGYDFLIGFGVSFLLVMRRKEEV